MAARELAEARGLRVVRDPGVIRVASRSQGPGDRTVQRSTPWGRECLFDRLSRELVTEPERRPVVGEHALAEGLLDRPLIPGGQVVEQVWRYPLPDDGRDIDQALRVGSQPRHARQRRV